MAENQHNKNNQKDTNKSTNEKIISEKKENISTRENTFSEIPKKYKPGEEELKILRLWEEQKIFLFNKEDSEKELFSIDTPPPTVSGKMHIGHSFSYAQEDFIARYKRLKGYNVFYPFGTDDNGLPTDKLVEKTKKVQSRKMERSAYRDLCFETIKELKEDFIYDWIRLGISCDYSKSYSTISKEVQKESQKRFIELYKKGFVYEQKAPMSWCPNCQTAVAQAEFESKDISSHFNEIIFKSTDGEDLIIATTRPEFLPACVALFAHPEDERYLHLKNKTAKVPLFDFEVPVLFDEVVEKEKGTGLMMVCTFGDKEDIDKWKRYNLPLKIIFTKYGVMNNLAGKYEGLKIKAAREKIIEDLKEKQLLIGQKEIIHAVNVHERCGTELEFLETKQWFIKILDKKKELLDQANKLNWNPEFMKNRMIHWIENLNWDWCISRQRFFGIPFPLWREANTGKLIFAEEKNLPIDPTESVPEGYSIEDLGTKLIPETDVIDTWATSSISPQISLSSYGLDPKKNLPMSLRPQAHDIIRTWAFYTLTRSFLEEDKLPWKDILISGFVMAAKGEKMSKSKGNVVEPRKVLEKYSADILRFWAAGSKLGEDLPYNEQELLAGQRFVTKLWNSFKFLSYFLTQEDNKNFDPNKKPKLEVQDKWILEKLNKLIQENEKNLDRYEYDKMKYRTEQFFWQIFCDSYIELVKDRLYKPEIYGIEAKESGLFTFYHVLKSLCIMISPITPFITEGIWQYFFTNFEKEDSISKTNWPRTFEINTSEEEKLAGQLSSDITAIIRKYKSEKNKPLNSEINLKIFSENKIRKQIELVEKDIIGTIKAKKLEFVEKSEIRGDIELGESQSKEKEIESNEQQIPKKITFFTMDVEFLEK